MEQAIASLQAAYERGWRQGWVLEIDGRLDPLRDQPEFLELQRRIEQDIAQARATVLAQALVMR
jgi:hypothetical protein